MPEALAPEEVLKQLTTACGADASYPPLLGERFDAAHEAFERSSSQQSQILACLRELALTASPPSDPMRILSVGPGNGMLDLPLIASLADAGIAAAYVGVDPNPVACRRFIEGAETLNPSGVSLSVQECNVDDLADDEGFDLIHAVHSLYYVPDPPETIGRLLRRLRPGGRLVIFQAPRGELNELSECFWRIDKGSQVWFSDRLESWLAPSGQPFEKQRIDARLDVTSAINLDDPHGQLVLDFILHTASSDLGASVLELGIEYLRAISQRDDDRWLAPHPVDAFVVSPV